MWRSEKATVAAAPTWDRNQHVCEFKVEALEASGILRYGGHEFAGVGEGGALMPRIAVVV